MRIYLDMRCFNRPYDDQTQLRISLESQAKLQIQRDIKNGKHALVSSYVIDFENLQNPVENRRHSIADYINKYASQYVTADNSSDIELMASDIMNTGVKHADALHIACALKAKCDCFITTDKRILRYQTDSIKILNPVDFIGLEDE